MAENVNSKNATIAAAPPRTREEIAESLRVRTRRGTPTEKLEVIMTSAGLDRVEAATVMVIGLGGVGSNCVEALARGGIEPTRYDSYLRLYEKMKQIRPWELEKK